MPLLFSNSRIRLPQGQIFWREIGQDTGTPLLFLHGSYQDSGQWIPVIEQLRDRYHCFAIDLLGFGDSEDPNVHYSIQLQVECLIKYLDALRLERVCLIGHSLGGWVAASFALQYPERVQHLVLASPLGVELAAERPKKTWERQLVSPVPVVSWLLKIILPLARAIGRHKKIEQLLTYRQHLLQSPTTCQLLFRRRPAEIQAEYLNNRLELLQVPTLILQGEQDTSANFARSQMCANLIPESKFCLIEKGNNDLPEVLSQRVATELQDFLTPSSPREITR
ncbi:alpha/beta fold hydrolase [Lusitaniella coriacea]|uniref:alpha/beta fold hydrolase n=1 Tax=Lusitaniella coriacea TaxID=1983105 RepID=UPI003CF07B34